MSTGSESVGSPSYCPRFVHPNDPNWPGRPCNNPITSVRTNSAGQRTSTGAKSSAPRATSHSPATSRFGPPLVSQTDLFRQLKLESDSDETESLLRRTQFTGKVWNHESRRKELDRESSRGRTAGRSRERHYPRNRSASPLRSRVKEKLPVGKLQSSLDNSTAVSLLDPLFARFILKLLVCHVRPQTLARVQAPNLEFTSDLQRNSQTSSLSAEPGQDLDPSEWWTCFAILPSKNIAFIIQVNPDMYS